MTDRFHVDRLTSFAAAVTAVLAVAAGPATAQDLPPTYGVYTLSMDRSDSFNVNLQAGGPISAPQILGPSCQGMVADAPDIRVVLEGTGQADMQISVTSAADTTLIVLLPNGDWYCDDDTVGLNPAASLSAFSGVYDIWVGTYDPVGFPEAAVAVSTRPTGQTPPGPAPVAQGGEYWYDASGTPTGPVSLSDIEAAITAGTITPATLVWQDGMAEWAAAETVPAIDALFPTAPPPLPGGEESPDGPPPLPAGPTETPEGKPDETADVPATDDAGDTAMMDACRRAADQFRLDPPEVDPTCTCVIRELRTASIDAGLLASFAGDFGAAAESLRAVDEPLYDAIDDTCF